MTNDCVNHGANGGEEQAGRLRAAREAVSGGRTVLGIELGSTRIKAVLILEDGSPVASGSHDWENRLENGVWTYHLEDVWHGLRDCYRKLAKEVLARYGVALTNIGAMGISGMMHGYLVFGGDGRQLAPFRTWRNTITEQAAGRLTEEFKFNIPQRWSIAHLYQAILNGENHVGDIRFMTTLAGYVHWKLTGRKVLGTGEASGVFPVDSGAGTYNPDMLRRFGELTSHLGLGWRLENLLPGVLGAGSGAGVLTEEGARLLDPSGRLKAGVPLCPPEGDGGTGMVATNSVSPRTGNVSAGTSVFAVIVLEKELSRVYPEIDRLATPSGKPAAMVHCNNCTSDLDAWVRLFGEAGGLFGVQIDKSALYDALYAKALEGEADGGGLLAYNYYSGEHITGLEQGRPLFVRTPDSRFTVANFMRTLLFSAMGSLKIGMDILTENENVRLDQLLGHGGLFKTKGVGQKLMAAALGVPITVMESAGEGGAWGIALLASYRLRKEGDETLEEYLADKVFGRNAGIRVEPDERDLQGFAAFMERYEKGLAIERAAVEHLQ